MFKAATVSLQHRLSPGAGQELAEALVAQLGGLPQACWLFCPPHPELQAFLQAVRRAVGNAPVVGCTTDGEICNAGFLRNAAVLGGIVSDRLEFTLAWVGGLGQDSEQAGRELGRRLGPGIRYLQLFSDGITGNGCALLRGLTSVVGPDVPIHGGTAGDYGRFRRTFQFAGAQLLTDAAVALGFQGDFVVGTGVRSGWSPIGIPKKVTRARNNVIYELNGQPALEVYERFLGKHAAKLPAVGVEYPLGLVGQGGRDNGEAYLLLRATMSVNREEGSITFAGEVPEGTLVRLTCGDVSTVLQAAREAARLAMDGLGSRSPGMAFLYSCMARRIILGRRTRAEVQSVQQEIGPEVPLIGFYTYGEYCPLTARSGSCLHNETATVSVLGI